MKPLVTLDLETTGANPATAKIIEIAMAFHDDGELVGDLTIRVNPQMPIEAGATKVHGITDEDVKGLPIFADVVDEIIDMIGDNAVHGYNITKFDLPILDREFKEAEVDFDIFDRPIVDSYKIFCAEVPRTMSGCYKFFTGKEPLDAHIAINDVNMAHEALQVQIERYGLGGDWTAINERYDPNGRDLIFMQSCGKLYINSEDELCLGFGNKFRGVPLERIKYEDKDYLLWVSGLKDIPSIVEEKIAEVLYG